MTPADLPCKANYHWLQWAGEWWCVRTGTGYRDALAAIVSRSLIVLNGGPELRTPAEVQSYYSARPLVPCPFVFEAP